MMPEETFHSTDIQPLISFLNSSATAWQATERIKNELIDAGYIELSESDNWNLQVGGRYFVTRNQSALIAFVMPEIQGAELEYRLVGAHTDSPAFKLKSSGETVANGCMRTTVEVYGGPILSSWIDRPLGLAGRVLLRGEHGVDAQLVHIDQPIAIIPNLAIHLNRDINKGFEYNCQTHLPVILGQVQKEGETLRHYLAQHLLCAPEDIIDYELLTVPCMPAMQVGLHQEFISSGRLDNLMACHSLLTTLLGCSSNGNIVSVGLFFDHEEIGSQSLAGANSSFASVVLERIMLACGGTREDYLCALSRSFMISNDAAHAVHPNYSDKHEAAYAPLLNGGPVIKISASQRYMTNSLSAAIIKELCRKYAIPCQSIINRSDIPSGSTIGPVSSAKLSVPGIDIGLPMWAMHSSCETAGVDDYGYMVDLLRQFFAEEVLI